MEREKVDLVLFLHELRATTRQIGEALGVTQQHVSTIVVDALGHGFGNTGQMLEFVAKNYPEERVRIEKFVAKRRTAKKEKPCSE